MEFYGCPECGHKIDDLTAGTTGMKCPQCGKPMILVSLRRKETKSIQLVFLFLLFFLLIAAVGVWFVFKYEMEEPAKDMMKPVSTEPVMARRRSAS